MKVRVSEIAPKKNNCKKLIFTINYLPESILVTPSFNTIEKLGLNLNKIKELRHKAIELFLDEEIDNAQLKVFVNGYLCLDDQQRYNPFWTTIKYLFSDLIE